MANWQVCGEFDVPNFRIKDTHYLIVPPATAERICRETMAPSPYPVRKLMLAEVVSRSERP
jgi:hypothetical protein